MQDVREGDLPQQMASLQGCSKDLPQLWEPPPCSRDPLTFAEGEAFKQQMWHAHLAAVPEMPAPSLRQGARA